MAGYFNRGLRSLVKQLNTDHPGSVFLYGNTYDALEDMLRNPTKYGKWLSRTILFSSFSS